MQHVDSRYNAKIDEVHSHLIKTIPDFRPTQEFIDGLLQAIMIKDLREFKRKMNYLAASEATRHSYLRVIQKQSMDSSIGSELHHPHPDIVRPVTPPPLEIKAEAEAEAEALTKYLQYPILEEQLDELIPLDEELDEDIDEELDEDSYESAWYYQDMIQYYD